MAFGTSNDLMARKFKEQELKRFKLEAKAKKLERDYKFRKFESAKQAFRQGVSRVDKSYQTIDRAGSRVFSGVRARMPRIVPTGNSSREVLNDAFKLDTDITRRRQF